MKMKDAIIFKALLTLDSFFVLTAPVSKLCFSADTELILALLLFQSDPLGLNAAPASGEGVADPGLGNGQRKRRPSEEALQGGPNSFKRPKVSFFFLSRSRIQHQGSKYLRLYES